MKTDGGLALFIGPFLYVLSLPFCVFVVVLNEIIRMCISLILKYKSGDRISLFTDGTDGVFSYIGKRGTRNVLTVAVTKVGQVNMQRDANTFQQRVINFVDSNGKRPYSKLENVITQSYGYPCWRKQENFNIQNHFRCISALESEYDKIISEEDVHDLLSKMIGDMDESKPQWEIVTIPKFKGKSGEVRSALIFRFQHAYMDGLSLISMFSLLADSFEPTLDPLKVHIPLWKKTLFYVNFILYAPAALIAINFEKLKRQAWIGPSVIHKDGSKQKRTKQRNFTWTEPIDFEEIRQIRLKTRATVPNIVGSAFVCAAKDTLPSKRILPQMQMGEIIAMIPYPNANPQNRFTFCSYPIQTSGVGSIENLKMVAKDGLAGLTGPLPLLYYTTFKFMGRFPLSVIKMILGGTTDSFYLSNVPFSKSACKIFDENWDVLELAGWPPQPNATGISLASVSYNNQIKICGVADSTWLTKEELKCIIGEMPRIIHEMAKEAGYQLEANRPNQNHYDNDSEALAINKNNNRNNIRPKQR